MKNKKIGIGWLWLLWVATLLLPVMTVEYMVLGYKKVTPFAIVTLCVDAIAIVVATVCLVKQIKLDRKTKAENLNKLEQPDAQEEHADSQNNNQQ